MTTRIATQMAFFTSRISTSVLIWLVFFSFLSPVESHEAIPRELEGVGIDDRTGQSIDLNTQVQNDKGEKVRLAQYFDGKRPVALFLVYYACPSLCTFVLNAGIDSLKKMDWLIGNEYQLVAASIDPKETPDLATQKKQSYMKEYFRGRNEPPNENGWNFLVSSASEVQKLTSQLGFKYKWVEETQQYAHASAMFILTPEGKISRVFYGIDYPHRDVRMALMEAGRGKIGTLVDKLLLFCYHYDATNKKYVLMASRIMTIGAGLTLICLAAFLTMLWVRDRNNTLRGS